jgi:hypothetical protein
MTADTNRAARSALSELRSRLRNLADDITFFLGSTNTRPINL